MNGNILEEGTRRFLKQNKRKRWHKFVGALACVVVFCTSYALILPAITMEKTTYCGQEEHIHVESCYASSDSNTLICGLEEHTHVSECYSDEEGDVSGISAEESGEAFAKETIEGTTEKLAEESTEKLTEESVEESTGELPQDIQTLEMEAGDVDDLLLSYTGDDYSIKVSYTDEAGIPKNAALRVRELAQDSDEFRTELDNANTVLQEKSSQYVRKARFFDIKILDENGNEIQPESPVNVEITLSDGEQNAEDLAITHTDDAETSVIENVETFENDGDVTASFEAEGFSTYGVTQTTEENPAEIKAGESIVLQGEDANYNAWESEDSQIVSVESSGSSATVNGLKVSDQVIKITHKYGKNKNNYSLEYFYVKVISGSGTSEGDVEEKVAKAGYTVTVKGNKKILENAELFVDEIQPEDNTDYYSEMVRDIDNSQSTAIADKEKVFAFLKMYHIYLSKDGGVTEYDPNADDSLANTDINLHVTITYDSKPEGWPEGNGNLYVGHYKKNGNRIENKGFVDSTGIQQIKVSGNSVTFHIKGFSVITTSVPIASADSGNVGGSGATAANSIAEEQNLTGLASGSNQWQVVDGLYSGNSAEDKIADLHDAVRIQKNVVPTGTENEFKVYLSVDYNRDAIMSYLLQNSGMAIETSKSTVGDYENASHCEHFESAWSSNGENENNAMIALPDSNGTHTNPFTFKITAFGKTYTVIRYTSNNSFNNGGAYLRLSSDKWLCIAIAAKGQTEFSGELTDEQASTLIESSIGTEVGSLLDEMGDGITVEQLNSYTGTATLSSDNKTINWVHLLESDHLTSSADGWYENAAEMVYTIKLDPAVSTGLDENTNQIFSKEAGKPENVETNSKTEMNYLYPDSTGTASKGVFSADSPVVRGMLYELKLKKVDKNTRKPLEGAEFAIYDSITGTQIETAKSGEDGVFSFKNLPWGAYKIKEIKAPAGYQEDLEAVYGSYTLCYTTGSGSLLGQGARKDALFDVTKEPIENESKGYIVSVEKQDFSGNTLTGTSVSAIARFRVESVETKDSSYIEDANINDIEDTDVSTGILTFKKDSDEEEEIRFGFDKIYKLTEIYAPAGYVKLDKSVYFKVASDGTVTYGSDQDFTENEQSWNGKVEAKFDSNKLIITVKDPAIEVKITKVDQQGNVLTGAAVTLTYDESKTYSMTDGVICVPSGEFLTSPGKTTDDVYTYTLAETAAPEGYYKIDKNIIFQIKPDENVIGGYSLVIVEDATGSPLYLTDSSGKPDITTNAEGNITINLKLKNSAGVEFPSTGGAGIIPYTLGGIALIAFAAIMNGYSMRRRRERRSM